MRPDCFWNALSRCLKHFQFARGGTPQGSPEEAPEVQRTPFPSPACADNDVALQQDYGLSSCVNYGWACEDAGYRDLLLNLCPVTCGACGGGGDEPTPAPTPAPKPGPTPAPTPEPAPVPRAAIKI